MKKIIIIMAIIILLATGLYFISQQNRSQTSNQKNILINGYSFQVEIADDPEEMKLGLGERDSLCGSCGMLFEYSREGKYYFWMKGMRFPIDIIWISK
ncbi:unnamed protein product, partial [marine sediment metagenome]